MHKALMLAAASAMVLSACSEGTEHLASQEVAADHAVDAAAPAQSRAVAPTGIQVAEAAPLAPVARIAYAFSYVISVPQERGPELMSRHEFACASAGPGLCQVISARADWTGRDPGGRLELRGQPDWINRFRTGLALQARDAGGRLDEAVTEGEDVTRGIDSAATGAHTTASLAERIRELQRRQGGTLAQRLEIERQLAGLQREYDAQQLQLRVLSDRVQSARLTLNYREGGVMGVDSPTRPVARALADAFALSMGTLALLITLGSVALPVTVISGVVWWAAVRRRRRPTTA